MREEGSSLCVRDCLTVALAFAAAAAPWSRSMMVRVTADSPILNPMAMNCCTLHHWQSVHCIHLENIAIWKYAAHEYAHGPREPKTLSGISVR